jgi:hypothetical protein
MEGNSTASEHDDCSSVVENENDWGLGDEVLEDLAVESHAASTCGSAGASHALHGRRSAARAPSVVQTGGAGSISSRSVVATGNYFNETAQCSCHVISARKVICPENACGAQGLRDYSWHQAAATAALPKLFGMAKHYRTKNADGELSYKYKDIQSEYVGNLDKLKLFRKCMEAFDMLDPFLIPIWMNPMAISIVDCWGDRKSEVVDFTKHWWKISLKHACAWQRDTFDWCTQDNNLTSMEWVKELLTNLCDINLVKRIDKKFDCLADYKQGGIKYLNMALDMMFMMSNMVIMLLQRYLKQFAQEGIAKVPNKDFCVCSKQLVAMCMRLAEVNALPQESIGFILEGLTRCSVLEFKDIHRLLCTTHKVRQMRAVTGRRDSSATLAHIQRICKEACEVFHSMNLTNKWNFPKVIKLMLFSLPVITVAHLITPAINALLHAMRPKSLRPRRHVLS